MLLSALILSGLSQQAMHLASESYVAVAPVLRPALGTTADTKFDARVHVGGLLGPETLVSNSYIARLGVLAAPGTILTGGPLVFAAVPPVGDRAGGTQIRVHGFGFDDGSGIVSVPMGPGGPLTGVALQSNTLLTGTTPPGIGPLGNPAGPTSFFVNTPSADGANKPKFLFAPALVERRAAAPGTLLEVDLHLASGDLYLLHFSTGTLPGIPIAPYAGALELGQPSKALTAVQAATTTPTPLAFAVPDDPALVGVVLHLQGVVIENLAPVAGTFTSLLTTQIQL